MIGKIEDAKKTFNLCCLILPILYNFYLIFSIKNRRVIGRINIKLLKSIRRQSVMQKL
jgi:hypothetical protein